MRLTDLDPGWWVTSEGSTSGRHGMGLSFQCPCKPGCDLTLGVWFANPLDGGPPAPEGEMPKPRWVRVGDTFETMTLTPSIDADSPDLVKGKPELGKLGHWHGHITAGEIK